ncbi:PIN2/TERF1-interacting telomerase inhibitor 1 isoform X2 [Narcine bancroftii]|uniref:PIN2/TERF1-interacting telomerase inhibitor 1 isoform X2 n=1 Tax=Narcine bancroftii TaxID=1343680 RepID=UPI003831D35A
MAMLAEPRRKQKWSVDPRNNNWKNDESRFGLKMLEKMGWSKGKGLGAHEQGTTENIKVQIKNNTVGLGATKNHEDNWIAHQDEFNELLSKLNDCHGQNGSTSTEDKTMFSLEEKSKSSKKRVHYQKYTKGKDLSSRSATDLACVFGKRIKLSKGSIDEKRAIEDTTNEDPKTIDVSEPKVEINTMTSSLSMQEYFASRIEQLKNRKLEQENQQAIAVQEVIGGEMQSSEKARIKPKKKKRKRDIEICNFNPSIISKKQVKDEKDREKNNTSTEDSQINENCWSKKSKRKPK